MRARSLGLSILGLLVVAPAVAQNATEAFERVALTYRALDPFAERLEYDLQLPDGRRETKAMEYGRSGNRRFMALYGADGTRLFHLTADEGTLRATQFNAGGVFLEGSFDGSLATALAAVGGDRVGLTVPPGLAALEAGEDAFVESFGFNVLPGLAVDSMHSSSGTVVFELSGEAGSVTLRADAASHRPLSMSLGMGEAGSSLAVEATFTPIDVPVTDPRWRVATEGRRPVADFAELEGSAFPLGQPAPDVEIRSLEGERVSLSSLEGRVVVLDFWATWCVPCWKALEHLQSLASWADASGLPVSVFAVDTLEQASSFGAQVDRVRSFLDQRGLDLSVLVDVDDAFFAAMHSPGLPSTVVIAPDGTLAGYHSGVSDDMAVSLEAEVRALLEP